MFYFIVIVTTGSNGSMLHRFVSPISDALMAAEVPNDTSICGGIKVTV